MEKQNLEYGDQSVSIQMLLVLGLNNQDNLRHTARIAHPKILTYSKLIKGPLLLLRSFVC